MIIIAPRICRIADGGADSICVVYAAGRTSAWGGGMECKGEY